MSAFYAVLDLLMFSFPVLVCDGDSFDDSIIIHTGFSAVSPSSFNDTLYRHSASAALLGAITKFLLSDDAQDGLHVEPSLVRRLKLRMAYAERMGNNGETLTGLHSTFILTEPNEREYFLSPGSGSIVLNIGRNMYGDKYVNGVSFLADTDNPRVTLMMDCLEKGIHIRAESIRDILAQNSSPSEVVPQGRRGSIVTTTEGPYAGHSMVVVNDCGEIITVRTLAGKDARTFTVKASAVKPWTD